MAATAVLLRSAGRRTIRDVDPEPLITRNELEGMLFAIADINASLKRIVQLLEEEADGEDSEEDA